ncbi:hypothetical protein [Halorubrum sp. DTA98]|uniref:hypothetical protein n=1 Tax=Halorubrum sp. DTA98 TaxID=3402163 RepID=UPI003AAD9C60
MRTSGPVATATLVVAILLVAVGGVAAGGGVVSDSGVATGDNAVSDAVIAGDRAPSDSSGGTSIANVDDDIGLRNELFRTDDRGTVGVRTTATVPDRLSELRITLHSANDDAIEADGFDRELTDDGDTVLVWDGDTDRPSATYRMDANVTADPQGPLAEAGSYRFVDVGEWAIVRTPRIDVAWRGPDGTGLQRENAVDGPGVASQAMAFLGPHDERVHQGGGQRFRLIVPDAADPVESPEGVFAAFEHASTALQVGARDDEVVAVTAPTGSVDWGVRGLQIGDSDLWVLDREPAGTADDVWTHEYVHTRQSYTVDESARWFTEGSATYYAALFALERGEADFTDVQRALARGEREPDASAVLADPATWNGPADYTKGALVAGEIDRQLRIETNGEASLATVFRDLNEAPPSEPVTIETFLDAVEDAAAEGADDDTAAAIRADAERFTTTADAPAVWDRSAHEAAFGETPAQVGYGIADEGVRATGEYRDRPVDRDPVRIVEGETLAVTLAVHNTGGVAGEYDVSMTVDGESVATRSGTVAADSETTARFEHAFAEPGEYEVRLGSETLTVVVSQPADVVVRDVAATPASVTAGEPVAVSATLGNDAGIPADSTVEIRVNGDLVVSDPVRLDANAETTLERDLTLHEAGPTRITVASPGGEVSTTVDVEGDGLLDGAGGDGAIDETVGDVPGFGPAAAVLALLSGGALLRGRRKT